MMNECTVTTVTHRYLSRHVTGSVTVTTVTPPYKGVTVVTLVPMPRLDARRDRRGNCSFLSPEKIRGMS